VCFVVGRILDCYFLIHLSHQSFFLLDFRNGNERIALRNFSRHTTLETLQLRHRQSAQ
jgi:hypothetical protein